MSTSEKVKAVLACCGKKQVELAEHFGMRKQNLATKMQRDSWSAEDLARVADFVGARIGFMLPNGTIIYLDPPEGQKEAPGDDPEP